MNNLTRLLCVLFGSLISATAVAEVRLPKLLQSHMVLQRDTMVRIWGWAEPGEAVRVSGSWGVPPATVQADADGHWSVRLASGKAGGPHTLTVAGTNTLTLEDILFGEVWLASGQSNMEMPLVRVSGAYTGIRNAEKEVQAASFPRIRLFQAGNFSSKEPLDDVEAGISMYGIPPAGCSWSACTPESVPHFASTAYFFARELHRRLQVPIGIIDASWGGTSAETWTPRAGLQELDYSAELKQADTLAQKPDQKIPTRLYNGMIHPLRRMTIKGAVWYQGEGNSGRADRYRKLFSTMIGQWRKAFGYEFPFYFVQISPFNYRNVNAAYLREAQDQTQSVPRTGMVVTMDIGNRTDIHPKNKQEVGRRLALWALAKDYGRELVYCGPRYETALFESERVVVTFTHAEDGLTTGDGKPATDFEIAGKDQVFHPATAELRGSDVILRSDAVPEPVAVRYAFHSNSMPNLANKSGLPAAPFRTDDWVPER